MKYSVMKASSQSDLQGETFAVSIVAAKFMELKCIISSAYLKNVAPFSVEKLQLYVHHICMNVFSVNGILDRQTNKQS